MNAKLITITVPNFPQNYTIFSILTNLFRQKCLKKKYYLHIFMFMSYG